jgi:hypothetical protein
MESDSLNRGGVDIALVDAQFDAAREIVNGDGATQTGVRFTAGVEIAHNSAIAETHHASNATRTPTLHFDGSGIA